MLKEQVKKWVDIKAVVTTFMVLLSALAAASTQVDRVIDEVSSGIYANVTNDTYKIVQYDLLKQLEKMAVDPTDIKRQDIVKFTDFCGGYFGREYIPSQSNLISRDLERACGMVMSRYDDG